MPGYLYWFLICRKVQESKDELKSFVKQFVAGRLEENSAEVDTKLRHIEKDVLRKSSKEIKASLDYVDNQMRAKRDDINCQMEQVASSVTDDKVKHFKSRLKMFHLC